jgi:hypothetical protein
MVKTKWMLLLTVAFLTSPVSMLANGLGGTVWDLTGLGPGGSISWDGTSAGALLGSGLVADLVNGNGTPSNPGANLGITNGSLSFDTGANSYNGVLGSTWSWGTGALATLKLTGCIAAIGIIGTCSNNVLLEDSFQNVQIIPIPSSGGMNLIFGGVQGTIDQTVANYFGLGNNTGFAAASFGFTITSAAAPGTAIRDVYGAGTASGGSIDASATAMPEDWSVFLSLAYFSFALAGFALVRRLGLLRIVVG